MKKESKAYREIVRNNTYKMIVNFTVRLWEFPILGRFFVKASKHIPNTIATSAFNRIGMQSVHPEYLGNPEHGHFALFTQSGIIRRTILSMLMSEKMGLSTCVSFDSHREFDWSQLREVAKDENTRVIALYIESIRRGRFMMEIAKKVTQTKPIVVLKAGNSEAGSRAVISHTGSLAGSDEICRAAFKQSGMLHAKSLEELLDYSKAFCYYQRTRGSRIGIVSNGGGLGIICADACLQRGLEVPRLSDEYQHKLNENLSFSSGVSNPIDLTALTTASGYRTTLDFLLRTETVDIVILVVTPTPMLHIEELASSIKGFASQGHLPIIVCISGSTKYEYDVHRLTHGRLPIHSQPERAAAAAFSLVCYSKILDRVKQKTASA